MESTHELSHVRADDTESPVEPVYTLPPIRQPTRPRCRSCHRNDRPVFDGVCSWCNDGE